MDEKEYIKSRLEDQITWYSKKSTTNKVLYNCTQSFVIVLATLIPLLSGYQDVFGKYTNLIIGIIGALVSITTGLLALFKFQLRWNKYRTTSETLIHEKYLFETKTEPYNNSETCFQLFVKQVESTISKENSEWKEYIHKNNKKQ